MELNDFVGKVLPILKTADSNARADNALFVKSQQEETIKLKAEIEELKKFVGPAQGGAPTTGGINLSKFLPSIGQPQEIQPGQMPQSYQQGVMENGKFVTKTVTPYSPPLKEAGPDTRSFVQKVQDSYNLPTITPADKAGNVIDTVLGNQWPTGFDWLRKPIKAAYETVTGSIKNAATGLGQVVDSTSKIPLSAYEAQPGWSKYTADGKLNPNYEKEVQANKDYLKSQEKTPLQRFVQLGEGVTKIGSLAFTQVMAELNAAAELPGPLSWPAKGVNWAFQKVGEGGSFIADKGVDALPISQESKDTIRPLANELGAFVAQLVGIKLAHGVAEKGLGGAKENIPVAGEFTENGQNYVITDTGDVMSKADYAKYTKQTGLYKSLPLPEDVKAKVSEGAKIVTGLAMNPFSTAFSLANAKIYTKIAERAAKGKEITPEEGKKIIEEVKQEMPSELGLNNLPSLFWSARVFYS